MLKSLVEPTLRSPVVLCAVSGWSDAGFVASGALRYLVQKRQGYRIAEFDSDAIYSYTLTRPTSSYVGSKRNLQWPELVWHAIPIPEAKHDLVILVGPEPSLNWKQCVEVIAEYTEKIGATYMLTLGAFFAQVHYAGPALLSGHSNDSALSSQLGVLGVRGTSYEGPTGFVTAVALAADKRNIKSASVWAAAPGYLSNSANPKLSAALLKLVEQIIDQDLDIRELEEAGREMEHRINEILKQRPDLQTYMRGVDSPANSETEQEEEPPELPSAQDVLKDLEEHLRRLRENRPDDSTPPDQKE